MRASSSWSRISRHRLTKRLRATTRRTIARMRYGGPILTALSLSLTQPRALMVATRRARPLCMKATDAGKEAASRAAVTTPDSDSLKAVAKPKAAAKKAALPIWPKHGEN